MAVKDEEKLVNHHKAEEAALLGDDVPVNVSSDKGAAKLTVGALRKSLPPQVFEKSLTHSLWYFVLDFAVIFACMRFYSEDMSWPIYVLYANVTGLFMWCLFVVGHDCGHNTFSNNKLINGILGHISHGFLLVPFYPWAKSHATHHAYHQHKDKDKSHSWNDREEEGLSAYMLAQPLLIPVLYPVFYLFIGVPDGSHYNPLSKLFATRKDSVLCVVSVSVCLAYLTAFVQLWGWEKLVWVYGVPWLVYNYWLYKVTFLQHHGDDTVVYGEGSWDFLTGGLQTIDRVYDTNTGALDSVMHNITNGHVVHHLFSTSIPHYHLMEATNAIVPQLGDKYKLVKGFPFVELMRHHWFATRPYLVKRIGMWEYISQDQYKTEKAEDVAAK
ncbi:hypothetical protein HDU98_005010 [Podochytrium sp. JEL0797]|nr:hypothetical protein HDU98_005010 [Podochytrium sp. JEL0797]